MQVTETLNAGLKREIKVVVPAKDMEARLMERLSEAQKKVRLNGFRPGKVPVSLLRKQYGRSLMGEVLEEAVHYVERIRNAEGVEQARIGDEDSTSSSFSRGAHVFHPLHEQRPSARCSRGAIRSDARSSSCWTASRCGPEPKRPLRRLPLAGRQLADRLPAVDGDQVIPRTLPVAALDRLEELDPELLAKALTATADTLGASKEEIGPALEGVARLSEVVSKRSEQTGALLESTRTVTTQLAQSSDDIVGLMKQANLVVSEITARKDAIHRLLVETTSLSRAITAIVTSTNGKLKPALTDIKAVLTSLNQQDKQLTHVLEVMAPAIRYVTNATGSGPFLPLYLDDKNSTLLADDTTCKLEGRC